MIYLLSFLFLIVGIVVGWLSAERFIAFMEHKRHDFEDLFEKNPHPELFEDGKIYRGDYTSISFDPGFDPDEFSPEDIITDEE